MLLRPHLAQLLLISLLNPRNCAILKYFTFKKIALPVLMDLIMDSQQGTLKLYLSCMRKKMSFFSLISCASYLYRETAIKIIIFLSWKVRIIHSSLFRQMLKACYCESDIPLYTGELVENVKPALFFVQVPLGILS